MPQTRINSASESNLTNAITEYSVDTQSTDGVSDQKETTWMNNNYPQYLGFYKSIPEYKAVVDAKSTWTIGKGFKADEVTTMLLDTIKGNGKDTFNSILENARRVMEYGGDSYAEIIRDDEDNLINIKPLDPASMQHVANKQGLLIRFEQVSRQSGKTIKKFKPEEIFYLPRNRVADEIHGTSMSESLEWIILAKNAVQEVMKTLMDRHLKPVMIFHLDTDDPSEIAAFKAKMDKAYADGENMYIPKDVVVPEVLAVAPNATLNPMPWLEYLNNQFYQASGVPQIILGGSGEFTEASAKIAYLAFQQTIEEEQLFLEEQVLAQLNLVINLEFPASLENELLSDNKKDGDQTESKPSETTAGSGEWQ